MTPMSGNRLFVGSAIALMMGACLFIAEPLQAATLTWSGSSGATWTTSSTNWNGATVATPWDATNGPLDNALFNTANASANAAGNVVTVDNITFTTAGSISGGTIDMLTAGSTIAMAATSGTSTISSTLALGSSETFSSPTLTSTATIATLNLTGLITSAGTAILNPNGNSINAATGSVVSLGGASDSFNLLQQGSGGHGTIVIASGGSVSCNMFFVGFYGADVVNGNLTCQNFYCNNSNAGNQNITGSGTITTGVWLSNHSGIVNLGTGNNNFTGALNVTGSFNVGLGAFPGFVAGTNGPGGTIVQSSGTVQLTGGGDNVTMGFNGTDAYKLQGGFLSIPNTAFDLGYGSNAGSFTSTFNQTGGLANIYGLSMGTTQAQGAQPGNCAVTVTGGTLNLGAGGITAGGAGTKSVTLGNATIGALAPWSTSQPITLSSTNNTTFNTSGGNIVLAGVVSGSGGLAANGSGTLLLDNANIYTGATIVSGGTLQLSDGTANVGSVTGNVSTSPGAVVAFANPNPAVPQAYSGAISGSGGLVVTGPGALVLTGSNSFTGGTTISGGTLQLGDGFSSSGTLQGGVTNNATLVFANPNPQSFAGAIGGNGAVLANGPSSLALSGSNTFSGGLTLAANTTLYVNSNTALGSGTFSINGGVVDSTVAGVVLGNVPQYWNADFTFGGANNLNLGSGAVLLGSNRNVTLNSAILTVNGPISDGGAGYSLSTAGMGTLVLGGTSTYSGGTNVNSGALVVNGALTGSGGLIVQSGGTLGGTGLVSGGGVTLNGGAILSPGPSPLPGSIGTFTASSLSVGNGAAINFDLSTSASGAGNDLVAVTGNLLLPAGNATIAVNATGGSLSQVGSYTLFNYGSLSVAGSPLVYSGPLGARQSALFNYGTGSNSSITLSIAGFFANLIWTGTGAATDTWDQNDTSNMSWTSTQHPSGDYFAALDNVTFDATSAPGNQAVTLAGGLTPTSVTVTGTKNYTFTGFGQIGGATALTVLGPGTLTIQNPGNNYTLGTNLEGGSIALGVTNGLPPNGIVTFGAATTSGTLDLAGNNQTVSGLAMAPGATPAGQTITDSSGSATLTYSGTGSSTFGGTITDTAPAGALAVSVSSGQLVLSGSNTFSGGTTLSGGTLQLAVSNALPIPGSITALLGATLDLGGNGQTTSGTLSLQGGTVQNGTITSTAAAFDGQSGTIAASLAGPVALNKSTGGLLLISSTGSSYTGGTNISGGTLQLGAANGLPTGGNITVFSGATFDLGGVAQSTSGTVSIQGGVIQGGTVTSTSAAFDGQSGNVTANLAGSVGLNKSTTGLLALGGSDTYTGNTVVSGGTLQLAGATGVPGGPTAGTLILNGGDSSAGVVDINGFPGDFGGLSGAAGAVPGMIVNNAIGANQTLTVGDNNASSTFSGTLADGNSTLGLTKAGSGIFVLAGSNAYSGGTTVSQGILAPTNTAALGTITSTTKLTVTPGGELQLPAGVVTSVGNVFVAGTGVTGFGAINGGTLNLTGLNVNMNSSTGTAVISSPMLLTSGVTVVTCTSGGALINAPITCPGSLDTSGSGSFSFGGGGVTSISGTFEEGNNTGSRLTAISVLPGTTLNCGTYFAGFFSTLTVGGTMNANVSYIDNSTTGNQFLNGQGVFSTADFIGSGGGTIEFSSGVLNVTSSATIGAFGPFGTQRLGCTFQQDSGTVNMTGTGDGFTVGTNASTGVGAYTQYGGTLNVPNQYVELCYGSGTAASYFQVLGSPGSPATANVYGISLGQTVNNGPQNGNGVVKLGGSGSRLVIGAGGIVVAGTGVQQVLLSSGTLASSAAWSTSAALTFNGAGATNIDASGGAISLDGLLGGSGGLCEVGSGLLVLDGTGTYTGGTIVAGGELAVANSEAIESGTSLYVGSNLSLLGTVIPLDAPQAIAASPAAPVPEPTALALLAAGSAAMLLVRRRGRRFWSRR